MKNLNQSLKIAHCLPVVLLSACTLPVYQPTAGETLVSVKLLANTTVQLCKDNVKYSLNQDATGQAVQVPVGGRIDLNSYMYFTGYNVSYTCFPVLSFIPQAANTYVLDTGLRDNKCYIELVKEDKSIDTGVSIDTSVAGPSGCFKR